MRKNENRSSRYSACPATFENPIEQVFEQVAQTPERVGQERQVADRENTGHRAPRDERICGVVADRADRREQSAPAGSALRDRAVCAIDRLRQHAIAIDQERIQTETLDLLRRRRAGADHAQVVELAPFRRPLVVDRVALRVEMQLADECRHDGNDQQHDQPRRIDHQADGEAQDGHDILRLAEQLRQQRTAAGDLAPRAVEAILQVGVLEVLQVERGGVLHEANAGRVRIHLRQQRIDQRDDAAEDVRGDGERKFQRRAATTAA